MAGRAGVRAPERLVATRARNRERVIPSPVDLHVAPLGHVTVDAVGGAGLMQLVFNGREPVAVMALQAHLFSGRFHSNIYWKTNPFASTKVN